MTQKNPTDETALEMAQRLYGRHSEMAQLLASGETALQILTRLHGRHSTIVKAFDSAAKSGGTVLGDAISFHGSNFKIMRAIVEPILNAAKQPPSDVHFLSSLDDIKMAKLIKAKHPKGMYEAVVAGLRGFDLAAIRRIEILIAEEDAQKAKKGPAKSPKP
jgi:hypothetical protein